MMRKVMFTVLSAVVILPVFIVSTTVEGSSGKLRAASICTGTNGRKYGQHGKDSHWHRAKKHGADWYSDGANLGKKTPCRKR